MLIKHLSQKFGLTSNRQLLSGLDIFRMYRHYDKYTEALKEIHASLSGYEAHICQLELDPRRRVLYLLSQNHFFHYLQDIHFLLSNPEIVKGPLFQQLYSDRHHISHIGDHVIEIYREIQRPFSLSMIDDSGQTVDYCLNLQTFYNDVLLRKYIDNLNFDFLAVTDLVTNQAASQQQSLYCQYQEVCQLLTAEADKIKAYISGLLLDAKWASHPATGMSQFPACIYQFVFEYHTGLTLKSPADFSDIKSWCLRHLAELQARLHTVADQLLPVDSQQLSVMLLKDKITALQADKSQLWSSKQEMIDGYQSCIDKYSKLFYHHPDYNFSKFTDPKLCIFDNPTLPGGCYFYDAFYLNVADWRHDKKCDVETLTLHEMVPGHHLQLDYSNNSHHTSAFNILIPSPLNGFIEGWGLFCESMGLDEETADEAVTTKTTVDRLWSRVGYIDANMLRTFRVLAEIMLHAEGQTPQQVIDVAKTYISYSQDALEAEVYRYRVYPGQACSYKVGLEVLRSIVKAKFPSIDVSSATDLHRPELLAFYKELLFEHEMPLQDLLLHYGVNFDFNFDFNFV